MRNKISRRVITALSVVLAFVALCFAVVSLTIRAPEIRLSSDPTPSESASDSPTEKDPSRIPKPGEAESLEATVAKEPVLMSGDRPGGIYTILLIGTSDDASADTLMVGKVDTVQNTIHVMSIPRDTKVTAKRALKKINGSLGVGGVTLVKKEVAGIIGFTPDFAIKIGLKGLIQLVDAIGGIDYDIPHAMNYDDPTQDLHIHFKPGYQHLDGQASMELLRFRGYLGSDIRRMEVQQEFLMIVAKKLMTPAQITHVNDFAEIYAENVETDLSVGNLVWFGLQGYEIGADRIYMSTLPTYTADPDVNPSYYQFVSAAEAITMINDTVNPFREKITRDNVTHIQFVAPVASET